jgi:hypothetical protein
MVTIRDAAPRPFVLRDLGRAGRTILLALAVLLGVGARASAADASPLAGGGTLRVTASPRRLVLGQDGGAELRIAAPPDVLELAVTTTAGTIKAVTRLPHGGFTARYVPPAERYPRVAIVAALGRTAAGALVDGWIAIPLHGHGKARIRARPGSALTLRIGDRDFGPVVADANGRATVPVVVPPGVREGHHGFRPVDLGVPETSLVHAIGDRAQVRADEATEVRFRAYVVAPHGAARRGDVPTLEATRGTWAFSTREPGAIEGVWKLPPGPAGEARLVASLPGAPASRAVVRVETLPGPPAAVALAFDRAALVAGRDGDVALTVKVLDAAGNPTRAAVSLASDAGALSAPAEQVPGVHVASLSVPPRFGGRATVNVTARVDGTALTATAALPLEPGAPATARLADGVVVANGEERALRLAIVDGWDNPVAAVPTVAIAHGDVLSVQAVERGVYLVRYRPAAVARRMPVTLAADVSGVRAEAELLLVPPRRGPTFAASAGILGGRGFEAPSLAFAAERSTEWLDERLALRLETRLAGWGEHGDHALTAVLAGVSAGRELSPRLELWTTAGMGLALGWASREGGDAVAASPAAGLTVGLGRRTTWGTPFLELGALAAGELVPGRGPAAAVTLGLGVRFDLSRRGAVGRRADDVLAGTQGNHGDHPHRR